MRVRKGIVLAGGTGTRLHPMTSAVSKQLMPIFDKPMIYYPISVLIQAGIRDILVITTPHDQAQFQTLLRDGSQWGLNIEWAVQASPDGIAHALIIAEDYLAGSPSALILGDNLYFGSGFIKTLQSAKRRNAGATIFGYQVGDPSRYGVIGFDKVGKVVSLVEKPSRPASNYAVTGLYFYDENAPNYAKTIKPSDRCEIEITELNKIYLNRSELQVELLGEGTTWLDTGTTKSLLAAAQFVSAIEERQGLRICCPEVESFRKGWISSEALAELAIPLQKSGYGDYLTKIASLK
jgi:glucose-1-phosphate thymidylyltransferase